MKLNGWDTKREALSYALICGLLCAMFGFGSWVNPKSACPLMCLVCGVLCALYLRRSWQLRRHD